MQDGRRAYVFYATNTLYALAVLVFVTRMRRSAVSFDCDIVLLHLPLPAELLRTIQQAGIITRACALPRQVPSAYYRDCLLKLKIFELVEYDRIVYVDADAIPLQSLEHLFSLPMDKPIAAPRAYWIDKPIWTTAFLVAAPSTEMQQRLELRLLQKGHAEQFDMDILNAEFADDIQSMPEEYFALDSEWEKADRPGYFARDPDILQRLLVVHFTALAKPWSYSIAAVRRLRPDAHPAFYELREQWRDTMDEILRELSPALRLRIQLPQTLRSIRASLLAEAGFMATRQ